MFVYSLLGNRENNFILTIYVSSWLINLLPWWAIFVTQRVPELTMKIHQCQFSDSLDVADNSNIKRVTYRAWAIFSIVTPTNCPEIVLLTRFLQKKETIKTWVNSIIQLRSVNLLSIFRSIIKRTRQIAITAFCFVSSNQWNFYNFLFYHLFAKFLMNNVFTKI